MFFDRRSIGTVFLQYGCAYVYNHNDKARNSLNMRKRFSCENCEHKTTSENSLKDHIERAHKKENYLGKILAEKVKSKRIHCNVCEKKFNKPETFNKHMKSDHNEYMKPNIQPVVGRSNSMNNNKYIKTVKTVHWSEIPDNGRS